MSAFGIAITTLVIAAAVASLAGIFALTVGARWASRRRAAEARGLEEAGACPAEVLGALRIEDYSRDDEASAIAERQLAWLNATPRPEER